MAPESRIRVPWTGRPHLLGLATGVKRISILFTLYPVCQSGLIERRVKKHYIPTLWRSIAVIEIEAV
ncbi:hypothetical protein EV561_1263 [Rhizobium sp. BK376]|nr:hypothetical protein EV561_1263 [Rhizobium sp. BK376]